MLLWVAQSQMPPKSFRILGRNSWLVMCSRICFLLCFLPLTLAET